MEGYHPVVLGVQDEEWQIEVGELGPDVKPPPPPSDGGQNKGVEPRHPSYGLKKKKNINPLTPRRTLVSPFTEISILF